MIYILNSPVLTGYGSWRLDGPISLDEARQLAKDAISAIGHQATADILTAQLGIKVEINRIQITMKPGDTALVFRLKRRLPEGTVLGAKDIEFGDFELAKLEYLSD